MKKKQNHHLAEVLCAFWFNPENNPWDSTYYGKYFDLIEKDGYTEKHEQHGFQVKFQLKSNEIENPLAQTDKLEPRMMFKNPNKGEVIIMAANYVSFHRLAPYESWEKMLEDQIKKGIANYQKIGLGKGLLHLQMLYLNHYNFDIKDNISEYFSFLPSMENFGIGREKSLLFNSQYELDPNLLLNIKLNSGVFTEKEKQFFLECSCVALNKNGEDDWLKLGEQVHKTNNKVFRHLTK